MDGFFVAKLKVEKRKKAEVSTNEAVPQKMLNEHGELVEVADGQKSAFNDAEDEEYIKGQSCTNRETRC